MFLQIAGGTTVLVVILLVFQWANRATDYQSLLLEFIKKAGLLDPLVQHFDNDDWRCAIGEASYKGIRVRFTVTPMPDGGARLLVTDSIGKNKWETLYTPPRDI